MLRSKLWRCCGVLLREEQWAHLKKYGGVSSKVSGKVSSRAACKVLCTRMLTTSSCDLSASVTPPCPDPPTNITQASTTQTTVEVQFSDATTCSYPHVWLRENCRCPQCYNADAIARMFLLEDLDLDIKPRSVKVESGALRVEWQDGHTGNFAGEWLHQRAFTPLARHRQRLMYRLPRELWGPGFEVPRVDYQKAMSDDHTLLQWLTQLETHGVLLTTDAPCKVGAINDLINRIGFVKPTHYGTDYEIVTNLNPNNLAYTGAKLGLHTDLPYYEYPPGTTWLHCIRQHEGKGGDNDLSDGLHAAEVLRQRRPDLFQTLVDTPVYFQDQGVQEYEFDKITKVSTIVLDHLGEIERLHIASQSRDTFMDLDTSGVLGFYTALKALNAILLELSISVKTKPGDILVVDNTRVLHGRQPFQPDATSGPRHVHNAYIDWDELRSKRRVLQRKLGVL